jgi:hypothetical protein
VEWRPPNDDLPSDILCSEDFVVWNSLAKGLIRQERTYPTGSVMWLHADWPHRLVLDEMDEQTETLLLEMPGSENREFSTGFEEHSDGSLVATQIFDTGARRASYRFGATAPTRVRYDNI